jgi:hypothetical protein
VKSTFLALLIFLVPAASMAQSPTALDAKSLERQLASSGFVGTTSVEFLEGRRSGQLVGCSLIYKVIFPDVVYRNGTLTSAVGNISFNAFGDGGFAFSLKLGTRPLLDENAPLEPPGFAYIVTSTGSSAEVKQASVLLEEGFKGFVYSLTDPIFLKVFEGLLKDDVIKIGFNRRANGIDQQFDVDLRVESSELLEGQIQRTRSEKNISRFIDCLDPLMTRATE